MDFPPDPVYVGAINEALTRTNGAAFHIDAIARVLGGDVERDRDLHGIALRALVNRGYLKAEEIQIDQGTDYPIYYRGWTEKGLRAIKRQGDD